MSRLLNSKWDLEFNIFHMKSSDIGTTLKHPKTINGNVKSLSKMIEMKDKENATDRKWKIRRIENER